MNDVEERALRAAAKGWVDAKSLASKGVDYSALMSAVAKLESEGLLEVKRAAKCDLVLTPEGEYCCSNGALECILAQAVRELGGRATLGKALAAAKLSPAQGGIALQWAVRKKLLAPRKDTSGETVFECVGEFVDELQPVLEKLKKGAAASSSERELVLSRRLAEEHEVKSFSFRATDAGRKALAAGGRIGGEVSQLSSQSLKDGSWRKLRLKPYDLVTVAAPLQVARKHAYVEFLQRMRESLAGMGFREVRAPLAELEFWNMDALFMPQDHPARDIHDVFKVKHPREGDLPDAEVFKRVMAVHANGGDTGSRGWRYEMDKRLSRSLVLRSHDTGISARTLRYDFRSPDRVFFLARVFRPDEIDWKHFIEFNQLGGFVVGESLSFRELLGCLEVFAHEVFGAKEIKFIPHYYPFTEPSVDLAVKVAGRGWTEVGGAGMFRPEMLSALGVSQPVVAWGLGIDRLAMLSVDVKDIRDLFSSDLELLRTR